MTDHTPISVPLVSVIVPAYNPGQTICQCLDSIVNQSYKNLEVIIIDDESTDNTLSICQQYAQNDSRVIALSQQNAGPSIARNRGLDIAQRANTFTSPIAMTGWSLTL